MGEEKRKSLRVSVARPVAIILSSGKKVHAIIANISDQGIGILSHVPGDVKAKLIFQFSLPIKDQSVSFKLTGQIIHSHLQADKYYSGVMFLNLSQEQQAKLITFIKEMRLKRSG